MVNRFFRLTVLCYCLISCSETAKKDTTVEIDLYAFLNIILRDTVIVKRHVSSDFVLSDISNLRPISIVGDEFNIITEKLGENDTTFINEQLRGRKGFTTDSLSHYGFKIIRMSDISTMAKIISADSIWGFINEKYGPGYYSISKPIFNKNRTKAYLCIGYSCGDYCGYGVAYILELKNGKWLIREQLGFWES